MSRSLEEMKRARGGHCQTCGKDIMDPEQDDHTFCNDCWDFNLAHPFLASELEDYECEYCEQKETHRMHDMEWATKYGESLNATKTN